MAIRSEKLRWGIRVSKPAIARYTLDEVNDDGLLDGSPAAALKTAERLNVVNDALSSPDKAVRSAELSALATVDAIFRVVTQRYLDTEPTAFQTGLASLRETLSEGRVERLITNHLQHFDEDASDEGALENYILNHLIVTNPAAERFRVLVEPEVTDASLDAAIQDHFDTLTPYPERDDTLLALLNQPQRAVPNSLQGQLEYIATNWQGLLSSELLLELLRSRDRLAEATKWGGPAGRPQSEVYVFDGEDVERFSPDSDWMPSCVVIARNTYVWLHQLSQHYGREISTLAEIPEDEFELLSRRGISGLWLIGLWERSEASRRIKEMCGNPDAVASAYSLYDYRIADALGGEEGYLALKEKAWKYGVRLAADMVPNHVGIVSDWVINHPDWFVSVPNPPFPSYTFHGPDLSDDPRVSVHLEDHYFEKSDAAVVFKRYDRQSGDERYIYHGNDGTSMPWNDTAQLDYLNPEVREAVIQTILHVARRFPIIRFDAAMTLVNKHIQRLWYPEPGSGGAIPSRADHGLPKEDFARRMPTEFWAEVVDRVAQEAPDTLLLAEAFWMLEGYFVRSLGMHRVYNSAFMNMLRDEKNDEYRQLMKNTLEFDPQILKRYVNFMNNPDEDTAEAQFGKGDKYFGVCTMMSTLPGLPMFGHGQVEGYTEKYGMDFRKPLRDERPDEGLVAYHEARIFPLLHRRRLFAEVDNFRLYDLYTSNGDVDENVFAYSNRRDGERGLVIYHNRYGETSGWVRSTAAWAEKSGDEKVLRNSDLAEGLELSGRDDVFYTFRDVISGLEFVRRGSSLVADGIFVHLNAYACHVFLDWREVKDLDGRWSKLVEHLDGRGVASLDRAWLELEHGPIYTAFRTLLANSSDAERAAALQDLLRALTDHVPKLSEDAVDEVAAFLEEHADALKGPFRAPSIVRNILNAIAETPEDALALFDEINLEEGLRGELGERGAELIRASFALFDDARVELADGVAWLRSEYVQTALGLHEFEGKRWFNKEGFDALVDGLPSIVLPENTVVAFLKDEAKKLKRLATESGYDFDAFLDAHREANPTTTGKSAPKADEPAADDRSEK